MKFLFYLSMALPGDSNLHNWEGLDEESGGSMCLIEAATWIIDKR